MKTATGFASSAYFSFNSASPNSESVSISDRIVIILPVWFEDELIDRAYNFYNIELENSENIEIHIVGSLNERNARSGVSCIDTINKYQELSHNPRIKLFEVFPEKQSKSNQLIEYLKLSNLSKEDFILFVDIDTEIPADKLVFEISRLKTEILQFHTLFIQNFEHLRYWQRGHALYQTRWTICHELRRVFFSRFTAWYASHLVGHGLLMRKRTYDKVGGFPPESNTEDVHFGYIANQMRVSISSAASFSTSDIPLTLWAGSKQQFSWAFGPLRYYAYFWDALGRGVFAQNWYRIVRGAVSAFFGTIGFLTWALQGPLIVAMISMAWFDAIWLVPLLIYLLDHLVALRVTTTSGRIVTSQILFSLPALAFEWLRRSIPAMFALFVLPAFRRGKTIKTHHE
ncbi:glycosyltransferase [Roseitalea porphyridii]|uniref:glycosyltransferase n=1 Tax=Roseitalea porphyridii TaxID=1852022 RepID=UPI0032F069BA